MVTIETDYYLCSKNGHVAVLPGLSSLNLRGFDKGDCSCHLIYSALYFDMFLPKFWGKLHFQDRQYESIRYNTPEDGKFYTVCYRIFMFQN